MSFLFITILSYNILPNIILIFSVLGIILIILRHLPEAQQLQSREDLADPHAKLRQKGLPAEAASKVKAWVKLLAKKVWNFALEAKDLKPAAATGYRIKKIFRAGAAQTQAGQAYSSDSQATSGNAEAPVRDEHYFLEQIRREPKNLRHYDALGRHYLEGGNFSDAKDIYSYLANHEPANADHYSKLAASHYKLKEYASAAEAYKKSIALDSTQPNRYYNLGLSLEGKGDYAEAIDAINKAIGIEPDNVKYYLSLSACQNKLGLANEARAALQTALEKDPGNETAKKKLEHLQ